jgi:hypothetical protein
MSARRSIVATTAIIAALLVAAPGAYASASRPGYQNVPNAGGEAGFEKQKPTTGSGGAVAGDTAQRSPGDGGQLNVANGGSASDPGARGSAGDGGRGLGAGLPYTGVNLLVITGFGCLLLVCGLLLMRATREH